MSGTVQKPVNKSEHTRFDKSWSVTAEIDVMVSFLSATARRNGARPSGSNIPTQAVGGLAILKARGNTEC